MLSMRQASSFAGFGLSEEQPTVVDYCVDCGCTLFYTNGKYVWASPTCPYTSGCHNVEREEYIDDDEVLALTTLAGEPPATVRPSPATGLEPQDVAITEFDEERLPAISPDDPFADESEPDI